MQLSQSMFLRVTHVEPEDFQSFWPDVCIGLSSCSVLPVWINSWVHPHTIFDQGEHRFRSRTSICAFVPLCISGIQAISFRFHAQSLICHMFLHNNSTARPRGLQRVCAAFLLSPKHRTCCNKALRLESHRWYPT